MDEKRIADKFAKSLEQYDDVSLEELIKRSLRIRKLIAQFELEHVLIGIKIYEIVKRDKWLPDK